MRRKAQILDKIALVAALAFALFTVRASAQDFKIRAKVDLVVVPVTVKGSGDKLITGLTKDDFIIYEDGQRQTITNFSIDPTPLSAAIVVDTGLSAGSLAKIQKTLTALAGAFSEFDEVAVYRYDKFATQVLDFSQNLEQIETAMNLIRDVKADTRLAATPQGGPFSIPGPVINGAAVVPPGQLGVFVTIPPKPSKVLNDAIFAAAADLAKRDRNRRKMVLVISDGDTTGSTHSFDETSQALLEKDVQVYAIGLDQPFPFKTVSVLQEYAKATGGDAYFVNSLHSIENSYSTVTEEARNQYILGYISSNEVKGAGPVFRDLTVEVLGRNLKPLQRKGYYQYP
jgi:VWFA-related protein